jgi:hypothetical protein
MWRLIRWIKTALLLEADAGDTPTLRVRLRWDTSDLATTAMALKVVRLT